MWAGGRVVRPPAWPGNLTSFLLRTRIRSL